MVTGLVVNRRAAFIANKGRLIYYEITDRWSQATPLFWGLVIWVRFEVRLAARGLTKDYIMEISLEHLAVPSMTVTKLIRALLGHRTRRQLFAVAHLGPYAGRRIFSLIRDLVYR